MSVRNFWTVFLKALGIWLMIEGFSTLTQFISAFSFMGTESQKLSNILYVTALLLLTIGVYFFVLWLFVYKTSWLIDKLKLEKGFPEEQIEFNIQTSSISTIAIIVFGGMILVDSLPLFCKQTYSYFQMKKMFSDQVESGWIVFYLVKSIIGYLLMTNSKVVTEYIIKQNK